MNTAQKLASSKPDRDKPPPPKAQGGWSLYILIAAIALYVYWKPDTFTSAFAKMKEWVLNQQQEIFSEGGGYGELPKEKH
jgi:hypothetical protein